MCVIIVSPNSKSRPSLKTLELCAKRNPHGSGLAWVEHGRVFYLKGLEPRALALSLSEVKGPAVIHFRWSSVGGVHEQLCHPFEIAKRPPTKLYGSADAVLFHNGTWAGWDQYRRQEGLKLAGPVSDTRVAAAAAWKHGFDWLEATGSKYARLTKRGEIRIIGQFHKLSDGCHYSNLYWQPAAVRYNRSLVAQAMAGFGD